MTAELVCLLLMSLRCSAAEVGRVVNCWYSHTDHADTTVFCFWMDEAVSVAAKEICDCNLLFVSQISVCVGGGGPHETELWISKYAFKQHFFWDVCGVQGEPRAKQVWLPKEIAISDHK